jgi:iron(III) transport system ATP-binding protein
MGREVAVLRGGRLIQVATPHELYQRPVDIALAQFVGEAVVLPGVAGDGVVRCALGSLATSCGAYGPVQVLIRPEQIRFVASGGVEGCVVAVTFYGPEASVGLSLPDGTLITARAPGYVDLTPGQRACVTVDGEIVTYPWVEAQPARV